MTSGSTSPDVHVTRRRIFATLIDALVFSGVNALILWASGSRDSASGFDLSTLSAGSVWMLVVVVAYYTLFEGLTGRTVGKFVTGIRVVDASTGARPGLLSGFVRTLLRCIDGLAGYLIGFIVVVNSKNRRRLGDMAAKTLVVRA